MQTNNNINIDIDVNKNITNNKIDARVENIYTLNKICNDFYFNCSMFKYDEFDIKNHIQYSYKFCDKNSYDYYQFIYFSNCIHMYIVHGIIDINYGEIPLLTAEYQNELITYLSSSTLKSNMFYKTYQFYKKLLLCKYFYVFRQDIEKNNIICLLNRKYYNIDYKKLMYTEIADLDIGNDVYIIEYIKQYIIDFKKHVEIQQ